MNSLSEHIKKKQREYYGAIGDGIEINPISTPDINVIKELVEIFKKINMMQVVAIMDNYKRLPDSKIEEDLIELNSSIVINQELFEEMESESNYNKSITFIDLNISRYKVLDIFSYCEIVENGFPCILLNETPKDSKKVPLVSNVLLCYKNEQDRSIDLDKLNKCF